MKTAFAPHLGRNVVFGRRRPDPAKPRLKLSSYLKLSTLPTPPQTCDYSAPAATVLADVMQNDQLGDCVIAGAYHLVGVFTGNATGTPFHATPAQVLADYSAIGGYKPGDPSTDQGCDEATALNYWTTGPGFANGSKLLAWLQIDATNQAEVAAACWLFENLYFGVELPDAWVNPFPSSNGFVWGVNGAADPQNGHCFVAMGYDSAGPLIDTWGLLGHVGWDATATYAIESAGGMLSVMLSPDQLARGATKAPNGVDWTALLADFQAMGGLLPGPAPIPAPAPAPPAPAPTGLSLADAQAAASAGLAAAWPK